MPFDRASDLDTLWKDLNDQFDLVLADKKHPFRTPVLSTVDAEGPNARTAVVRHISDELHFSFFSDERTAKVTELRADPRAAVTAYHHEFQLQLRMRGSVVLHDGDEWAKAFWQDVQGAAQKAYNPIISPGTVISSPADAHQWPNTLTDEHFTVIEFIPAEIDLLLLQGLSHVRAFFMRSGGIWESEWIAP